MIDRTDIVETVITISVLHHKDLPVDDMSLENILLEGKVGEASVHTVERETSEPLSDDVLRDECGKHGTDVAFFLGME